MKGLDPSCSIGNLRPDEWKAAARLIAEAVPNAIISHLGDSFGVCYYRALAEQPYSCAFGAHDDDGRLLGLVVGTLNYRRCGAEAIASQRVRLALAANVRLLSPAVIGWVARGLLERRKPGEPQEHRPAPEMFVVVVRPPARGRGLGRMLVEALEAFMRQQSYGGDYVIRTEAGNAGANQFYARIGARLVRQNTFHGRLINEWHKSIAVGETTA